MKNIKLHDLLKKLQQIQKVSGAQKSAEAVERLVSLANDNILEDLEQLDIVSYFVAELDNSVGDKQKFVSLLSTLKKPGVVSADDTGKIASKYLRTSVKFRSKKLAIEAIRDARAGEDRLNDKLAAS